MNNTLTNRKRGSFAAVVLLGELLLTYVGALLTYELIIFSHSGELALGLDTLRFDPYLAALAAFVVLVGRGIVAFRTHPDVRDHLVPGAFEGNELIVIQSITLLVGVDGYVQSNAEGLMRLGTVLFVAVLALGGVVGVLVLLRWAYLGNRDESENR